jgi:glycosyltransferase involved in cell wall biosynthesis
MSKAQESSKRVTLLVHTRNEAARIERCIDSGSMVANRIVVVDMESTDATRSIVRRLGGDVYEVPNSGVADTARAFGLSLVQTEWVLVLDADEVVPPSLAAELLAIVAEDRADAVNIPFRTFMFGSEIRASGWQNDAHVRLFKRDAATYGSAVHEFFTLNDGVRMLDLHKIDELSILHFNYRTIAEFLEKLNRYTDHEALKFTAKPSMLKIFVEAGRGFLAGFVHHRGFRDGEAGFVLAVLMVVYRLVSGFKARVRFEGRTVDDTSDSAVALREISRLGSSVGLSS